MTEGYDKLLSHTLIIRFVKEIFNKHPLHSRHANIWGINTFLTHYVMSPNSELDFKCLCKKLFILFLIHGDRRKQALTSITVENVIVDHDKVILLSSKILN